MSTKGAARPDIVIALVGAVGSLLTEAVDELETALGKYEYSVKRVRLSDALACLAEKVRTAADESIANEQYFDERHGDYWRIRQAMARGTAARAAYKGNSAPIATKNACLAALAVHAIARHRSVAQDATCFVVHSVKTKAELDLLRDTYGQRLLVLGVHGSKAERQERLTERIRRSAGRTAKSEECALHLIGIDEKERGTDHGQDIQGVFERCDLYINATARDAALRAQMERVARLIFVEPFETPTRDEAAMSQAHVASLQSAAMARQVGAALVDGAGDVIALGFNEVPRYGGVPYGFDHTLGTDGRDHVRGYDESVVQKRALIEQLLRVARNNNLLRDELAIPDAINLIERDPTAKDMLHANVTEFVREVHAEMMAITAAARRGIALAGCTLFTTTFPCHNCAKHVIAAGVREVVFIEAYPKSLALTLYSDSISMDQKREGKVLVRAFEGVAPRSYAALFAWRERRGGAGEVSRPRPGECMPWFTLGPHPSNGEVKAREERVIGDTQKALQEISDLDAALKVLTRAPKGSIRAGLMQRDLFGEDELSEEKHGSS